MKFSIFCRFALLGVIAISLFMMGCGDESSQQKEETAVTLQNNVPVETTLEKAAPPVLLGKWKHIESRISDLEPIHMEETYIDFSSEGKVTTSNPNDPDMDDLTREYTYSNGMIVFDQINHAVEILTPDSMVLIHEVDGDQIKLIYVKEE